MFSIATQPAKQSVSETITVLSGRLGSATLLEDRRAAILGLRSFAKDYPASVSSGALRSLIGTLDKDGEDVDTVKVVLETLLMLFSPNEDSPEASDEIALWLADEFTQRQENITLLLKLLDSLDFYGRLYSLQLLGAILSARPERTEECIITAPDGISSLVSVLEDQREAVRNESISLLTYLTLSSVDIQKLVVFGNAFEKLFVIINSDGALAEGGRAVEDSLVLLANLLRRNTSNQSFFREEGWISRLADLLGRLLKAQNEGNEIADWALAQRNRNAFAFLAVIRLFLMTGSLGTSQNQVAFWKHGLGYNVLQLAFGQQTHAQIQAEALLTSGDMVRNNAHIQGGFASQMVPAPFGNASSGTTQQANGHAKVYVIDGLLDLTLSQGDLGAFDVRFAACECLKAYFSNHAEVRAHFLARAIDGYKAGGDEITNVLTVLLKPSVASTSDPYQLWFAAVIAFHLLYDNPTAKTKASELTEGDSSDGEEVVTSIQTVTAHLIAGVWRDADIRVLVGYLMLLLGWLFEDLDAVNDFLSEGSNVQSLLQVVLQPGLAGGELIQGLCAMVLGVAYEFSTKDSPIPRATLHSIILSRLDRDRYLDKLGKVRNHPILREFEVTPQKAEAPGLLPEVFFDAVFVDFFKDNYGRISRAIDRDPGLEISVITNGVQRGVSRDLVDSLRHQIEEKDSSLDNLKIQQVTLQRQLDQEKADHRRTKEETTGQISKAKGASESQQRVHEAELRKSQSALKAKEAEIESQRSRSQQQLNAKDTEHQKQLAQIRKAAESEARTQSEQWKKQLASKDSEHQQQLAQTKKAVEAETKAQSDHWQKQLVAKEAEFQKQLAELRKSTSADTERIQRRTEAEIADLKATISRLEVDLMKANKSKQQETQSLRDQHAAASKDQQKQLQAALEKTTELEQELGEAQKLADEMSAKSKRNEADLTKATKAQETTQSELDDLLMVLGDLEEKVAKYKSRLRELGETVSDGEDDDDDEKDGSDDEDDEAGSDVD